MSTFRLSRVLELVAKDIAPDCQIVTLLVFFFIAERGTCTQKDVEEGLDLTNASTSRNVSYWTERRFDRERGMGYVERVPDEFDRRLRNLSLTEEGKRFYRKLVAELDDMIKIWKA